MEPIFASQIESNNVQNMVAPATSYDDIFLIIPILKYFIDTTGNGANNKRRESLLLAPFSSFSILSEPVFNIVYTFQLLHIILSN